MFSLLLLPFLLAATPIPGGEDGTAGGRWRGCCCTVRTTWASDLIISTTSMCVKWLTAFPLTLSILSPAFNPALSADPPEEKERTFDLLIDKAKKSYFYFIIFYHFHLPAIFL